MSDLLSSILSGFGDEAVEIIGKKVGIENKLAQGAIKAALPTIIGALAKNTKNKDGAMALDRALEKDHDGGILNQLPDFLNNFQDGPGAGILKHVLGNKRGAVESALGSKTGVDSNAMGSIMEMLAPVIMGQMGKQKKESGLGIDDIAGMLGASRAQAEKEDNDGILGGILGSIIDQDGDGDVKDDLLSMGGKMLGNFLRKKR